VLYFAQNSGFTLESLDQMVVRRGVRVQKFYANVSAEVQLSSSIDCPHSPLTDPFFQEIAVREDVAFQGVLGWTRLDHCSAALWAKASLAVEFRRALNAYAHR